MTILNIIQCTNLAGMERASLRLMQAMHACGHRFQLISLHPLGALESELASAVIPSRGLSYRGPMGVTVIPQLAGILRKDRSDAIIMTGPHLCAMMAMVLSGRRGSFLAVHFHHRGVKSDASWRVIYRMALRCFDWVTFPSDFVRDEACEILPDLIGRSLTIRYPYQSTASITPEERRLARKRLEIGMDDFVVGNAGWLITRKRFDVFLKVAAKVAAARDNSLFLIAGGGQEEGRLKNLARDLGIGDRVRWLGWQNDLSDFYASLDAMLFNADWDTLPVTPQEAVAHGIPLVASLLHGGLREVFDDLLGARILPQHDIELLASQLIEISARPVVAISEAQKSRNHYMGICDPYLIARQHEQLLSRR